MDEVYLESKHDAVPLYFDQNYTGKLEKIYNVFIVDKIFCFYKIFFTHTIKDISFLFTLMIYSVNKCNDKSAIELLKTPCFYLLNFFIITIMGIFAVGYKYQFLINMIYLTFLINNFINAIEDIKRYVVNNENSFENSICGNFQYLQLICKYILPSSFKNELFFKNKPLLPKKFVSTLSNIRTSILMTSDEGFLSEVEISDLKFTEKMLYTDNEESDIVYNYETTKFLESKASAEMNSTLNNFLYYLLCSVILLTLVSSSCAFPTLLCITLFLRIIFVFYNDMKEESVIMLFFSSLLGIAGIMVFIHLNYFTSIFINALVSSFLIPFTFLIFINRTGRCLQIWNEIIETNNHSKYPRNEFIAYFCMIFISSCFFNILTSLFLKVYTYKISAEYLFDANN